MPKEPNMKTTTTPSLSTTGSESSKLISLLALATGAIAMPQTSSADIIFSDHGGTVSWDGNRSFILDNLLGTARLGFQAYKTGTFSWSSMRSVTVGRRGTAYAAFKMALVPAGQTWGAIAASVGTLARLATAQSTRHGGSSFTQLYMAFEFRDTTAGNAMRYGWVDLTLDNGNLSSGWDYPKLTISRWAYDTTGAQLATGAVPEPSSMSLLALGALALGAKGVRAWRRNSQR